MPSYVGIKRFLLFYRGRIEGDIRFLFFRQWIWKDKFALKKKWKLIFRISELRTSVCQDKIITDKLLVILLTDIFRSSRFQDKLAIEFKYSQTRFVKVHAYGFGTTIVSNPPIAPLVELGHHFRWGVCVIFCNVLWNDPVCEHSISRSCLATVKNTMNALVSCEMSQPSPQFQLVLICSVLC